MHTLQLLSSHLVPLQESKNSRLHCACAIFRSWDLKGGKKRQREKKKKGAVSHFVDTLFSVNEHTVPSLF